MTLAWGWAAAGQVSIPMWALVYMPILVTISTLVFTDGGWHWALHYVLFENAMSVVKTAAMVSGLLELSNAHEWGKITLFRAESSRPTTRARW
jgi:beta-mannan synthase